MASVPCRFNPIFSSIIMKCRLVILCLLFGLQTAVSGQSTLKNEQEQAVNKLIRIIKTKDKTKIAGLVRFPLRREYPLKDVKSKEELVRRFDEIFDKWLVGHIATSKIGDWSEVGWRGIMLDRGTIWIDDEGKIMTVNYQSEQEKRLLAAAITASKEELPPVLRDFEKPVYRIVTRNYNIRIDEKPGNKFRYISWKVKHKKSEPDLVLENGVLEFQGSGGNHTITFKNKEYAYVISVNEIRSKSMPEVTITVLKDGEHLMMEGGKIIRN